MLTLSVIILLAAFVTVILNALGKCPEFVPIFLLCVLEALRVIPIR